jgi:hypothetical protein
VAKVIFKGWRIGMRKISFTLLLRHSAGLTLKQAQAIKIKVLDNEEVAIDIDDVAVAESLVIEADKLGVIAELIK